MPRGAQCTRKFRSHAYSAKLPYLHGCAHALPRVVITRRRGRLRLGLVLIGLCLAALIAYLGIVVELEHIIDKRVGLVEIVDEVIVGLVLWEALRGLRAAATSRAVAVAVAAGPGGSPGTAAFTATASSATCSAATYPASRSVPLLLLEPLDLLASKLLLLATSAYGAQGSARTCRLTINNVFEVLFKPTRSRAAHAHSYTSGSALNQRAQPQAVRRWRSAARRVALPGCYC